LLVCGFSLLRPFQFRKKRIILAAASADRSDGRDPLSFADKSKKKRRIEGTAVYCAISTAGRARFAIAAAGQDAPRDISPPARHGWRDSFAAEVLLRTRRRSRTWRSSQTQTNSFKASDAGTERKPVPRIVASFKHLLLS